MYIYTIIPLDLDFKTKKINIYIVYNVIFLISVIIYFKIKSDLNVSYYNKCKIKQKQKKEREKVSWVLKFFYFYLNYVIYNKYNTRF